MDRVQEIRERWTKREGIYEAVWTRDIVYLLRRLELAEAVVKEGQRLNDRMAKGINIDWDNEPNMFSIMAEIMRETKTYYAFCRGEGGA